jgi:protein-tyrosine-phosphatase
MKILFVCDGNICRSPLAAEYLRDRAVRHRLSDIIVDSAGLLGIEGAPAAPYSIKVGSGAGLDLTGHRSRGVTPAAVESADLLLAMTNTHLDTLARRFPRGAPKRLLLRAFEHGATPRADAAELDDPVRGPIEGYREAFAIMRICVDHLISHLKQAS